MCVAGKKCLKTKINQKNPWAKRGKAWQKETKKPGTENRGKKNSNKQ